MPGRILPPSVYQSMGGSGEFNNQHVDANLKTRKRKTGSRRTESKDQRPKIGDKDRRQRPGLVRWQRDYTGTGERDKGRDGVCLVLGLPRAQRTPAFKSSGNYGLEARMDGYFRLYPIVFDYICWANYSFLYLVPLPIPTLSIFLRATNLLRAWITVGLTTLVPRQTSRGDASGTFCK
jgi:hypothetical protein